MWSLPPHPYTPAWLNDYTFNEFVSTFMHKRNWAVYNTHVHVHVQNLYASFSSMQLHLHLLDFRMPVI